ncbi:MAG: hypothetical protein VX223_16860 [Myxococcota bacterium]|nr:hypothetical protein [Myxococcota bacterium]
MLVLRITMIVFCLGVVAAQAQCPTVAVSAKDVYRELRQTHAKAFRAFTRSAQATVECKRGLGAPQLIVRGRTPRRWSRHRVQYRVEFRAPIQAKTGGLMPSAVTQQRIRRLSDVKSTIGTFERDSEVAPLVRHLTKRSQLTEGRYFYGGGGADCLAVMGKARKSVGGSKAPSIRYCSDLGVVEYTWLGSSAPNRAEAARLEQALRRKVPEGVVRWTALTRRSRSGVAGSWSGTGSLYVPRSKTEHFFRAEANPKGAWAIQLARH